MAMANDFIVHFDLRNQHKNAIQMLEGAADYIHGNTNWQLLCEETVAHARLAPFFDPTHGIQIEAFQNGKQVRVGSDPAALATIAIDHLIDRGFRRLCVYALSSEFVSAFIAATDGRFLVEVFDTEPPAKTFVKGTAFVASDVCAAMLSKIILKSGLRVPDDVAILGIGNDPIYCEPIPVPLSSIDIGAKLIGFRSAQLLHRLLQKREVSDVTLVPPRYITERASTDTIAIEDDDLRSAILFIRRNAHRPLEIADVLRHVPVHRRSLERRFRSVLGRSPTEELRRARVAIAQRLLARTDAPLSDVARSSGFALPQHLAAAFKQVTGQTPSAYRDQLKRK